VSTCYVRDLDTLEKNMNFHHWFPRVKRSFSKLNNNMFESQVSFEVCDGLSLVSRDITVQVLVLLLEMSFTIVQRSFNNPQIPLIFLQNLSKFFQSTPLSI